MKDLMEVLAEIEKEQRKYFKNYKRYAKEIKKIVRSFLKDARVFVFGSVARGDYDKASDIDLIIVSKEMPKKNSDRAKIKAKIYQKLGFFIPFEIHMVTEEEFEWYERFIDKKIEIV